MVILPGLTSTKKERITAFVADLRRSSERRIALFPTCLSKAEREALYHELESIPGLTVPHVHIRSDCDEAELAYLSETFGTEAFNIHPRKSTHPFGRELGAFASRIFVENVDIAIEDAELEAPAGVAPVGAAPAGICPDFSHLENARLQGRASYVETTLRQLTRCTVGCCHLSAIRVGYPNAWAGEWDHHEFASFSDFDYLAAYRRFMPTRWGSMELENSFEEQLEARAYISELLAGNTGTAS
jgi:hypothetical protein